MTQSRFLFCAKTACLHKMTAWNKSLAKQGKTLYDKVARGNFMKLTLHIGTQHEDEVVVYAQHKSALTDSIEQLINSENETLMGYKNETAIPLQIADVYCFTVENDRVFACTDKEKLLTKTRLYKIEERLPCNFVKINQSCIVNIATIARFDTGLTGTLSVTLKNGFSDYVSRRNLKCVKERMGLKK